MAGPVYSLRFFKRFIFDIHLSTGILSLKRTSFHIRGDFPSYFYNSYEPAKGASIGFKFGLGLRFKILNWLGLRIYSEMLYAHPQLKGRVRFDDYITGTLVQKYETNFFNQKFQMSTFGLSLVFMLK